MEQEGLINSQESVIIDDGGSKAKVLFNNPEVDVNTTSVDDTHPKEVQQERRSARLKKDVHLTTMEKNEALAKKRSLEGNISKNS